MLALTLSILLSIVTPQIPVNETPRCEDALMQGLALGETDQREVATAMLNEAIALCSPPQSVAEKQALAKAHVRLGVFQFPDAPTEAYEQFSKAADLDPDNLIAALDLGATLTLLHRFSEGVAVAEKAIAHGTDDSDLLGKLEYNAGYAMLNMCVSDSSRCDMARAEKHFLRSAELKSDFPSTYFSLAAISNDIHHDKRRAMDYFHKACDLGDEDGCARFERFKAELGGGGR
jgi:tetratricopeptide (TPR) repeat protein